MSVNVANLFDRNPLHVAHLQGPVDRLPDANLRPVYERAGKILLIQRWKEPKSGESHAFLLFETEQAAMACCSRIGALRVTSDRQNSRPITANALSCTTPASSAILNQWLHSQHMVPSYVMKNPPPAPPSASFPLACLTPLTENCGLVVQMLREHKCALSWWRFVAQMYVSNKMWTPAQFILRHSTKNEEETEGQIVKGKESEKENQTIDINTTAEDIIDISDDSIGENMSESEDNQNPDFARAQKLQKEATAPAQLKAPPTGPRRFGNAWLPHKRPNVQNARAKLGIVPVVSSKPFNLSDADSVTQKSGAKSSTTAEKPVEKVAAPTPVQASTSAQAQTPATLSAPPVPNMNELAAKPEPTPAVPKGAENSDPSNPTNESPAPSTPAPSSAPAPPEISPPFVPTPMSASPKVTRPPPPTTPSMPTTPSLPSTPTPAPALVNNSSLPRPPPTLPPPPTALATLPTPPKTSASTPTRPASQSSSRAPSQTPSRQASQTPARTSTTSPASASKPAPNPPSSPSLPAPPSRGSTSPSRPPPRGPSLASLIRPKTTELGLAKIPQSAEAFQVQQRVQVNMVVPDATGVSASTVGVGATAGPSTSASATAATGVLPALPAGMPQRPSWIPTGSANTSGAQESGPSASSSGAGGSSTLPSPVKPTSSMPAPAVPATAAEKVDDIPSVEMAPPEVTIESPNLGEVHTVDHTDRQMSDVEDLRPTNPEDQHSIQPEGQRSTIEPDDQRPKESIDQRGPPRSTPKKRSRWFLSDDKEETPSASSPVLVGRTESLSSVDALVVEPESLVVEPEPHLFGSSLTSPVISSSLTSPHSTPAKRKSELDARGFEARLKKRRHRESRSDTESVQASSSVPDLPAYGSGPTLPDSVFGVSLPGVESNLTTTLAVIPPETYGRTSEEPSTPKSAFRTRLVDSSAQRPRRSRSPLSVRIERPVASGTRTAEEAALENEFRLARRTSLSDMDPRTWKATLDENEALKMKIRVLELTLPTAESVKSELHAERKEKTQLIESLEIERSLLVQSEALRKHSDTTRKELETRISQLEDRLSDSASALEHARESAHAAAEQRRRAEEASRIADAERSKVGVQLDVERALVSTERAALAKEREGRAEAEAKCAAAEARLAAEQRRYAEASEVARKELSEAKDFLDAEKALSGAQEAMLAHERELKDEAEVKLDEAEARAAEYAEEKKAAETKLDEELERVGKMLNAERALVAKEQMTIAEEKDARSKLEKQLKAAQYQAASHKDRMTKADGLLTVVTEQLAKSNEQLAAANGKVVEVENQLGLSVKAVVAARTQVTLLEEQLSTANGNLATTTEQLTKAEGELATTTAQLATANEQLSTTTAQLTTVKDQLTATEQREQGIKVNLLSWHRQLAIARDQTAAMEKRTRLAEERAATMELAQQTRTTDLVRAKQVLESEQEVLMMERATLARERILRKETEKKLAAAEERLVALEKHASDTRQQLHEHRNTGDGSSEQIQTQRTLMHMARMRIQELEQAVQRIEADLDASRSAEATAKTMIQLGWGSMRPRPESSPMSDMDPEFPDERPDAMDEDSETGNPFMSLMKPPRQQSFKLKRTAIPARVLKVDMPSGECVNIDLGGLPSNPSPVMDLLHKSKCAGVFWDIIMDEYGAMGCFEAAEAIAMGKLKYQP